MTSFQAALIKNSMRLVQRVMFRLNINQDLNTQRKMIAGLNAPPKLPETYQVEALTANGVEAEWLYHQQAPQDKVVLDIHGGAFILGSIAMQRKFVYNLARVSGARCLSVGYRLAPEHPYPAGLEDCLSVYRWLLEQGFSAQNILVVGDSAGGSLALALTLALKDQGLPLPNALVLLSPCTDLLGTGASIKTKANLEAMLPPNVLDVTQKLYTNYQNLDHPYVSPLYGDYHAFPPMLIHVGTDEILLDDSIRLAEKAQQAGAAVQLKIWPGMFHVFTTFDNLPESKQSLREMGDFIRARLSTRLLTD
jgi:acetyl esterase/lipase